MHLIDSLVHLVELLVEEEHRQLVRRIVDVIFDESLQLLVVHDLPRHPPSQLLFEPSPRPTLNGLGG